MRKVIYFVITSIAIVTMILLLLHQLLNFKPEYPIETLKTGWTVIYHNEQYINTNLEKLSSKVGSRFSRGDTLTLTYPTPLSAPGVPYV